MALHLIGRCGQLACKLSRRCLPCKQVLDLTIRTFGWRLAGSEPSESPCSRYASVLLGDCDQAAVAAGASTRRVQEGSQAGNMSSPAPRRFSSTQWAQQHWVGARAQSLAAILMQHALPLRPSRRTACCIAGQAAQMFFQRPSMRESQSGRSGRPASTNRLNSCCCVSFPVLRGTLHNHNQHSRQSTSTLS